MGRVSYILIAVFFISMICIGENKAATVIGQAKFTTYSTNRQAEILALQTGKEDSGSVATHAGLTSTHGVTGNIVGTGGTQTLTGKTLNSSTNYIDADALHTQVLNNSGGILYPGQAVYASTHTGAGVVEVAKARANSPSTMPAFCLVEEQIADGAQGSCRTFGILNNVSAPALNGGANAGTSAFSDGDVLYVSPTSAGALTNIKPSGATEFVQAIGTSVYQSATVGVINVNPGDVINLSLLRGANTGDQTTITGNAGTATTLQTSRNIQGVAFNGSADINIINGTGFVKSTGTTLSYDNSTYLTTSGSAASVANGLTITTANGLSGTSATYDGSAAVTISHLNTDGNLHVPATSTTNSGKVLTAGATAGSLSWQTPSGMVYPGAGIPLSTGSAWGTSITAPPGGTTTYLRADGSWQAPGGSGIGTVSRTSADYTTSSTTASNITGLSVSLAANTDYYIRCYLNVLNTATSTLRLGVSGSTSPTRVNLYTRHHTTSQTTWIEGFYYAFSATAQQAAVTTGAYVTNPVQYLIEGVVQNGANAGTLQIHGTASTAGQTSTVYKGAFCMAY